MSNHPKRGLAVTHFRPNPEVSYRLRYTYSFQNCVPASAGTEYNGVKNRIGVFLLSCVPLRYALPGSLPVLSSSPIQLRKGVPKGSLSPVLRPPFPWGMVSKGGPCPPSSVPLGVGFQRRALPRPSSPGGWFPKAGLAPVPRSLGRGIPKGEGRSPRPLCRWGSRAKSKRPGAFLPGCGAGSFPEKNAPHVPAVGTAPLREQKAAKGHPGSAAYSCTGDRPAPGSARRWGWRGCGCLPPPKSGW